MKKPIEYGVTLSKKERRGLISLSLLILFLLFLKLVISTLKLNSIPEKANISSLIKVIDSIGQHDLKDIKKPTKAFKFNPNSASIEELSALGLPDKIIKTIVNYRSKGGKFKRKKDFKKIYNLKEEDYIRLEPFIDLETKKQGFSKFASHQTSTPSSIQILKSSLDPNELDSTQIRQLGFRSSVASRWVKYVKKGGEFSKEDDLKKIYGIDTNRLMEVRHVWKFKEHPIRDEKVATFPKARKSELIKLEVNSASAVEWQYLSGIGDKLSQRIVKYRDQLGGFNDIEQVSEIYGLSDSTFQVIKPNLILESKVMQIRINCANKDELAIHPYISYKQAELLCNYRIHHGPYTSHEDLYKLKILTSEWVKKISPYFDFTLCTDSVKVSNK